MSKAIYFLSDLHLGAAYITQPLEHEKRIVRVLDSIKDKAAEIYLLGDILDYWYEYSHVVPKGFVRFFGKIAELADSGIKIHWLIGNHDIWIFDYLPRELGIEVIDGILQREILGKNFFMNHGDGVGKHKLSFRIIRSIFRNKVCQFFKILVMETSQTLSVEFIPFFQILKAFSLILYNQVGMGRTKGVPNTNLFVDVAIVTVLNSVLDNLANLLLQQVDFLDFKGSRLNNQKGKVSNLTEI